jgi:hypothetical protein
MAYRDDVDALFNRATSLQEEVDRLRAELDATRAPAAPPEVTPLPAGTQASPHLWERLPMSPPIRPMTSGPSSANEPKLPAMRPRTVWLPPPPPPVLPGRAGDEVANLLAELSGAYPQAPPELGVLVARLTPTEYALITRAIELLGDDDFRPAPVRARQQAFDALATELRASLAGPG